MSEFELLQSLNHLNIVTVYGMQFESSQNTCRIFMEWMPSGSVLGILEQTKFRLHEKVIRRYLAAALDGLAYLQCRSYTSEKCYIAM